MVVESLPRIENPETLQNRDFARILRDHGIRLKEAQQALQFFCGNNWGLVKSLNINAEREGFPIRHNVAFSERSPVGLMQREVSFAFMEGRTYTKAGFSHGEDFDFINFQVGSLFGVVEVDNVSSIKMNEDILDVVGTRFIAVDTEGRMHFRRDQDEYTAGMIVEGFTLDTQGGIEVNKKAFLPGVEPVSDFELICLSHAMGVESGKLDLAGWQDRHEESSTYLNLRVRPSGIQLSTTDDRVDSSFALIEEGLHVSSLRTIVATKKFFPLSV